MPGNMLFLLFGCSTTHFPDDSAPLSRQGVVREGRLVCCFSQENLPEQPVSPLFANLFPTGPFSQRIAASLL